MIFPIPSRHHLQSVREFLLFYHLGKSHIYQLEQANALYINGESVKTSDILKQGDELLILFENIDETTHEAKYFPLDILWEDRDYLLVNKPGNLLVHSDGKGISLSHYVAAHYHDAAIVTRCLHRLDVETTGMVLFSKHLLAHAAMAYAFEQQSIEKEYVALCEGKFNVLDGVIDQPIGRNRHDQSQIISKTGKSAHTEYHVVSYRLGVSRVKVKITGGRRHQIRVHLASLLILLWGMNYMEQRQKGH
ncbi:MAG: RluA family pseudouridine synthase [Bacilli bacterium]